MQDKNADVLHGDTLSCQLSFFGQGSHFTLGNALTEMKIMSAVETRAGCGIKANPLSCLIMALITWSGQMSVGSLFLNSEHSYLSRLIGDKQMLFHTLGICAWVRLEPIIWSVISWETVSCVVVSQCCFIVTETKLFSFVPADIWTFEHLHLFSLMLV